MIRPSLLATLATVLIDHGQGLEHVVHITTFEVELEWPPAINLVFPVHFVTHHWGEGGE